MEILVTIPGTGNRKGGNDAADMITTCKAGTSHIPQPSCAEAFGTFTNDARASRLHLQTGHLSVPCLFGIIRLRQWWKRRLPACAGGRIAAPSEAAVAALRLLLGSGHLGSHFSSEVVLLLLDALAHHVQREAFTSVLAALSICSTVCLPSQPSRRPGSAATLPSGTSARRLPSSWQRFRPACQTQQPCASATLRSLAIRSAGTSSADRDTGFMAASLHGHVLGRHGVTVECSTITPMRAPCR